VARKTFARRSYIYLDLATQTEIAQIRFCALPDATRNFSVKVSKRPTVLACRSFCLFGVISFQSKPWKLTYTLTNQKVQLPTVILIPFWKLKTVRKLIQARDCKVSPLIVHSHEYVYLDNAMLLRDMPDFSGQLVWTYRRGRRVVDIAGTPVNCWEITLYVFQCFFMTQN
jgi:hypothetical protein